MVDASTKPLLRIGELARELGLNPKTIRYYEEIGLLPEPARSETGYRLYSASDRECLHFIIKAKGVGLTLSEIGDIVALRREGEKPCEHVLTLLDLKLAAVDRQLRALKEFRDDLSVLREEAALGTSVNSSQYCWIIEQHEPHRSETPVIPSTE